MYLSLDELKTILGITGTEQDSKLEAILKSIESYVFNLVGDLNLNEKTQEVEVSSLNTSGCCGISIDLINKNATQITEVNGIDYSSKVAGTDYYIKKDDTVMITGLCNLIKDLTFCVFNIKYMSGYEHIPDDLKLAIANMVGFEFGKVYGKTVTKEKTGPRDITFGGFSPNSGGNNNPTTAELLRVIELYRPLNLKLFT